MPSTKQRVALITGANKGIGFEVARQLGQQSIVVAVAARDLAKANAAVEALKSEGIDAHAVKLDVTNAADIAALPGYFKKTFGRLDILVNNAGISIRGPEKISTAALRQTFETNTIAPHGIIEALLPLLKASPGGRIVNQSSQLGSFGVVTSGRLPLEYISHAYSSSKAALNMLTVVWEKHLDGTPVKVNAAHPGWVRTDMGGSGAELDVEAGAKTAVALATLPDDGPTGGFFYFDKRLPW